MTTITLHHAQLNASFNGVQTELAGNKINKFKGMKYGHIPARFERPKPISADELNGKIIDATKYGYVYPFYNVDQQTLSRIPPRLKYT